MTQDAVDSPHREWSRRRLDAIAVKIQDGTHFSPKLGGHDRRYITSRNLGPGTLRLDAVAMISQEEHAKIYRRCDVQFGDLLLTKDGANTGNAAINTFEEEISLLSSVAFVRVMPDVADTEYLLQYIVSVPGRRQITDAMAGNAITRSRWPRSAGYRFRFLPWTSSGGAAKHFATPIV